MSGVPFYDSNNRTSQLRSENDPSETLPGTAGGRRGPDYSASENMNPSSGFGAGTQNQDRLGEFGNSGLGTGAGMGRPGQAGFENQARDYDPSANDFSASATGNPGMFMATEDTTTQGGTGVGRREYESGITGNPGVGDKITGGTQKLAGKVMNNPGMQQKGELRETVGKTGNTDPRF